MAGTSIALWQAHEAGLSAEQARTDTAKAQVEAATAKAVQGFIESVFNANTKFQTDPQAAAATTARELLDRGAQRIATELASVPQAQSRLYEVLAEMCSGMFQFERSMALFQLAAELATRLHGRGSEEALAILLAADAFASHRQPPQCRS